METTIRHTFVPFGPGKSHIDRNPFDLVKFTFVAAAPPLKIIPGKQDLEFEYTQWVTWFRVVCNDDKGQSFIVQLPATMSESAGPFCVLLSLDGERLQLQMTSTGHEQVLRSIRVFKMPNNVTEVEVVKGGFLFRRQYKMEEGVQANWIGKVYLPPCNGTVPSTTYEALEPLCMGFTPEPPTTLHEFMEYGANIIVARGPHSEEPSQLRWGAERECFGIIDVNLAPNEFFTRERRFVENATEEWKEEVVLQKEKEEEKDGEPPQKRAKI